MPIDRLLTGVGRIVWGNPARATIKKDQRTGQPVLRDGKQVEQWAFGVAFPKAEFGPIWQAFQQEAASVYPQGIPPQFSWKIKDGDGVDRQGKPYSNREGYAGCVVLTVSTEAFAPQIFKFENGAYRQIGENEIKTGDFVRLNLNVKANAPTNPSHTPGLFVNPNGIEFVAYGQEIVSSGADPDELFKGVPIATLPVGASLTPTSSAPAGMPMPSAQSMPTQPVYAQPAPVATPMPGQQPAPGGYAQPVYAQPAPLPAPAHDFVQNAGVPQQPGFPQPAPASFAAPAQPGYAPALATSGAAPVTGYPSNAPMPGFPQPR